MKTPSSIRAVAFASAALILGCGEQSVVWPEGAKTISIAGDSAIFLPTPSASPRPLLVALHPWSGDFTYAKNIPYAEWCKSNGWSFIAPNYNGPNNRPEACASPDAVARVFAAVAHAQRNAAVDAERIFLVGASGGGHMALMMAARQTNLFTGISAWCPISDLSVWYHESRMAGEKYADDLISICGGKPSQASEEYAARSPATQLSPAITTAIEIYHGSDDQIVPPAHSLVAFRALTGCMPQVTSGSNNADFPKPVSFRATTNNVRLTIFEGGHEMLHSPTIDWLAAQSAMMSD